MQAYCLNEFAGLIITCDEDIKTLNFPAHMTKQANMLRLTAILLGVHMLAFIALR